MIINGKSVYLPFSNLRGEIPPHFAPVCARFERRANRRPDRRKSLKRNGRVSTEIVPDCQKPTLQAIIRGRVALESVIHSDGWGGYDGLVDMGYRWHLTVAHGRGEWARGEAHINGIEGFWGFAKSRLAKFRGMNKQTFYLLLKECEFRFNHRHDEVYEILLESCRERPIKLS